MTSRRHALFHAAKIRRASDHARERSGHHTTLAYDYSLYTSHILPLLSLVSTVSQSHHSLLTRADKDQGPQILGTLKQWSIFL